METLLLIFQVIHVTIVILQSKIAILVQIHLNVIFFLIIINILTIIEIFKICTRSWMWQLKISQK